MSKNRLVMCALLISCHSSMDDMDSMRGDIDDIRRETIRHVEAARAAPTMQGMHAEMDEHRSSMMPLMANMTTTMDSMTMHCDGLATMRAMHGELDGEMTHHRATIDVSTDLAMAMAETERHGGAMLAMMDGMDGAMHDMHCR